jgi:hypothetical protein
VVSYTPLPLPPRQGKSPQYALDKHQSPSGRCGEEKNFESGNRTRAVQLLGRRYTDFALPTPNNSEAYGVSMAP